MSYPANLLALLSALGACSDTGLRPVDDPPQPPVPPRVCDDADLAEREVPNPVQCWEEAGWSEPVLKWFEPDVRAYAAGPLEDTNGDGVVNRQDATFLVGSVRISGFQRRIYRVDPRTAALSPYSRRGDILLDVGDGFGHRVWGTGSDFVVHAWSPVHKAEQYLPSGAPQTTSGLTGLPFRTSSLDGPHEVSAHNGWLTTFTNRHVLAWDVPRGGDTSVAVVDLDQDGNREVVQTFGIGNLDGSMRCKRDHELRQIAVVDIDGDGAPETVGLEIDRETHQNSIVIADECTVRKRLYTGDGTLARPYPTYSGSLSIADFKGDGSRWIAFVSSEAACCPRTYSLKMIDAHGNLQWERTLSEDESSTHPLAVDFDGDGAYEVLATSAGILSGISGEVLAPLSLDGYLVKGGAIKVGFMVTDLENDGHLDLLVNTTAGLYAFEGANGWAPGPGCWPHFDYDGVSVDDNCRVPMDPEPAWRTNNSFRAAPSLDIARAQGSDLTVRLLDVCDLDCADEGLRSRCRSAT